MALHTMYLAQGCTILSITIRFSTMEGYLCAATALSISMCLMDPHANICGKMVKQILKVT